MSFKLLFTLVVLIISSEALQGPCNYKNVTIMSGVSFKPIVTPAACGTATVNASELSTKPNVILNSVDEAHERNESYTFMLLEEIPNVRDLFKLRWLVSNVTPLRKSLTANETSIPFAKYSKPTADPVRKLKLFLYVYKQNKTAGTGLVGLAQADFEHFAPQKWVTQNERLIQGIVGGAEFYVNPNASHAGHTNTHGGPVLPPMGTPGQHYPGQPQPGYPSQQPGYPSQQPGYPSQQPGYPSQQPAHPGQQPYPQPGTNQPTVINNNHYYGKVKDDKKKKNSAVSSLPLASLVAVMASVAILRP